MRKPAPSLLGDLIESRKVDERGREHDRKGRFAPDGEVELHGERVRRDATGGRTDVDGVEPPPGGLLGPPVEEGVIGAARRAFDESKVKRGGDRANPGRFSAKQGAGPPATSGRRAAAGVMSSKPGAPAHSPAGHSPYDPVGGSTSKPITQRRTPLRPEAPGLEPKAPPKHLRPKLTEEELPKAVGKGSWTAKAADTAAQLKDGRVEDTEVAYRTRLPGPDGEGTLGPYSAERIDLHNRIIGLLFEGAGHHKAGGETPQAIFMAGGPATGKSSLIRGGHVKLPDDAVDVNPDIVKTMLPEYDKLVAAGDTAASSKVHEESSHIAKMAMNLAVARGHHVVVDGTGNSTPGKFAGKVKAMLSSGYDTRVVYATTDVDTALKRADDRGKKTGRFVPTGYIRSSHRDVSQRFSEDISAIPGVGVEVYDTSDGVRHIASIGPNSTDVQVKDQARYNAFIDKGKQDPDA